MRQILLDNLKLSGYGDIPGLTKCMSSDMFPGYSYLISPEGKSKIDLRIKERGAAPPSDSDPAAWLLSVAESQSVAEFESKLFVGFADVRDALSRLEVEPVKTNIGDTVWLDREVVKPMAQESTPINVPKMPNVLDHEALTFAEYDSVVELLKTIDGEPRARRAFYESMLEALHEVEGRDIERLDSVLDVLFTNLIVSIQMAKHVYPDGARWFMSAVTKAFVVKDVGGAIT